MDIICKDCQHSAELHDDSGCQCYNPQNNFDCECGISETSILRTHITEQQAHIDTCQREIKTLITERDTLKNKLRGWLAGLDCWTDEEGIEDLDDMLKEMQEALS